MDEKISKYQMVLANKMLERRAAELNDVAMFRGIPSTAFDKEHLVMLCNLFANEHYKVRKQYDAALNRCLPSYVADCCAAAKLCSKQSVWRKIWNKIKSMASSTPDSARAGTKANAKASRPSLTSAGNGAGKTISKS